MKKFVFEGVDSVKECILEMDIATLRQQVKHYENGGLFHSLYGDRAPQFSETMLDYIDSVELKRDLERIYSKYGKIDLTSLPDVPMDGGLQPGYFASMTVLIRLYAASQRRKANPQPIQTEAA